jgi:hypothetical protein
VETARAGAYIRRRRELAGGTRWPRRCVPRPRRPPICASG